MEVLATEFKTPKERVSEEANNLEVYEFSNH